MSKHTPEPDRRGYQRAITADSLLETRVQRRQAMERAGQEAARAGRSRQRGLRQRVPSRRVRLRRTMAVLMLLAVVATSFWLYRDGRADTAETTAVTAAARSHNTSATVTTPTASAAASSAPEDGSATALPTTASRRVVERGNGRFTVLPVPAMANPTTRGRIVRYSVEVEGGLGVDTEELATTVERVLLDERSWQPEDGVMFVNVTPEQASAGEGIDIRVTLASPKTTDQLCAPMRTLSQVSCWNGKRSVLNLRRWLLGAETWGGNLAGYRAYLINHEVGHGLGHEHVNCPGPGRRGPVMLQQSLRLQGCTPWGWPKGDGV